MAFLLETRTRRERIGDEWVTWQEYEVQSSFLEGLKVAALGTVFWLVLIVVVESINNSFLRNVLAIIAFPGVWPMFLIPDRAAALNVGLVLMVGYPFMLLIQWELISYVYCLIARKRLERQYIEAIPYQEHLKAVERSRALQAERQAQAQLEAAREQARAQREEREKMEAARRIQQQERKKELDAKIKDLDRRMNEREMRLPAIEAMKRGNVRHAYNEPALFLVEGSEWGRVRMFGLARVNVAFKPSASPDHYVHGRFDAPLQGYSVPGQKTVRGLAFLGDRTKQTVTEVYVVGPDFLPWTTTGDLCMIIADKDEKVLWVHNPVRREECASASYPEVFEIADELAELFFPLWNLHAGVSDGSQSQGWV